MIIKFTYTYVLSVLFFVLMFPLFALAQQGQILSVTPPLFQLSIEPGDIWSSNIKVVNGNPYDLTIYVDIVNFAPNGEGVRGNLYQILQVILINQRWPLG